MFEKKSLGGSKKDELYEALLKSVEGYFEGSEVDHEKKLMETLERETEFNRSLLGLDEEEREKRIKEREIEKRKEMDELICSIEKDLEDPDIDFREKESLSWALKNLKKVEE